MAAITTPRPSRTGADTLATPGSRSATLCAQPRRHTSASARALNTAFGNTAAWVAASVWASNAGARARGHRQPCPDRDRIAKARSWFQCGHADPRRSLAAIYLHAFAGGVAQLRQYRRARHQQWIVDMGREFGDGRTEPPVAILAAPQQAMHLQRGRQPVCGGPGQVGSIAEFGQSAGRFRDRVQHANGFVEDTDTAMLSHKEIIASRILR